MKPISVTALVVTLALGAVPTALAYDPLAPATSGSPSSQDYTVTRLEVYPRLPDIAKYKLVLFNAEHSVFTDRALPGDTERRKPNHHRVILALSTAFWDPHLRGDAAAREWLHGESVRTILEKEDRWQCSVPSGSASRQP